MKRKQHNHIYKCEFYNHTIAILLRRGEGGKMSLENESEVTPLKKNLEVQMARNELLEKENKDLRQEVARLKSQIISLKAHNIERKSILWKKIQKSMDGNNSDNVLQHKAAVQVTKLEKNPTNEKVHTNSDLQEPATPKIKDRSLRVPPPPPRPASNPLLPSHKNEKGLMKVQPLPTTAPPPPPTPPKSLVGLKAVRRVPEVIELYRSLTRKDANKDKKINTNGTPAVAFSRNMIEEIENRSTFLSAIKSDVQRQGEFISFLIQEVASATYADISEVEAFVKWLDGELSSLVDERSVLKHFPHWPEQKADALREASCNYRDLKNLESEVSSFEDNPKEPLTQALKRMQALLDRLERSVNSAERTRESASKRYRNFHIPWEWMLDTGLIGQMKLSSLRLAREFMKRVTKELESNEASQEDNLLVQGVRFSFRVHQFAGGFDTETIQAFQELKKIGNASIKL
ncbi:CHUP1 [Spatholobus suberectus]|nr:CHUP1 [Spatholobus suberectus]